MATWKTLYTTAHSFKKQIHNHGIKVRICAFYLSDDGLFFFYSIGKSSPLSLHNQEQGTEDSEETASTMIAAWFLVSL